LLEVGIPDNSLSNCADLREKTVRAGMLARALAVFRADSIFVYKTPHSPRSNSGDSDLLLLLLKYLDTPQYLRKRVFHMTPALKYAGLLPPLRTQSHPLLDDALSEGSLRWGIQTEPGRVDIGIRETVRYHEAISESEPTLFRVVTGPPNMALERVDRSRAEAYFGYEVLTENDLIDRLKKHTSVRVVFSRSGTPYRKVVDVMRNSVLKTRGVTAVFGSPTQGVSELFSDRLGALKQVVDFWVNTVENQGTETVRLEEALPISLGLLNSDFGDVVSRPGFYAET